MAVINYDEYWQPDSTQDYTGTTTTCITFSMTCPHCNMWIYNYQWFHFCPYCGKPLFPSDNKKIEILNRLDRILDEIKEIKKKLECDE